MKIKVCGMKYPENIQELIRIPVDYMGFIFYNQSPRYVGKLDPESLSLIPSNIKTTGVFVNEEETVILKYAEKYGLKAIQLHGTEPVDLCRSLRSHGLKIIKAFQVIQPSDLEPAHAYDGHCDYFLFDTKTPLHGGSGRQFDWTILKDYQGNTPFLLSGGIGPENAESVKTFSHPRFYGIDLNSRFEIKPGQKDVRKIRIFIENLK